jgi:hypothetical protein
MVEIVFSHVGLATTTVIHALLTLVTGIALLTHRYGYPPRGRRFAVVRVAHTTFGVLMIVYLVATYLVVPL